MEFDENRWQQRIILAAGVVAILVGVLSWQKGIFLEWLVLRMLFSFAIIYGLCWGSILLFNRSGPEEAVIENLDGQMKGNFLDVAVGDEEDAAFIVPKQIDANLSSGNISSEQQAEMVRRMGWGEQE